MNQNDPFVLSIRPEVLESIRNVLKPGETPVEFVDKALSIALRARQVRGKFIDRALTSRANARLTGSYVTADDVLKDLEDLLRQSPD